MLNEFQSTLPTRGSDHIGIMTAQAPMYFNPRSPRGGATPSPPWRRRLKNISIHAPHEGERPICRAISASWARFQSTLPTRGSDHDPPVRIRLDRRISIHAPHEGERPLAAMCAWRRRIFQSTLPTRGSDPKKVQGSLSGQAHFNPRSPRGGATNF